MNTEVLVPTSERLRSRWARAGAASLVVVFAGAGALFGAGAAGAAAAPSAQDVTYMKANAQTSLAEITIGGIALDRSSNAQTHELATMTIADHKAALAKLTPLAQGLGVTLPTAPNPDQQAAAAKLKSVSDADFDLTYAQVQVAGHQLSIAMADTETSQGGEPTVIAYAQGYLPVATHHLEMAQSLLSALGGTPTAVPAGSGGLAATESSPGLSSVALGAGGLLLVLGMVGLIRRRAVR